MTTSNGISERFSSRFTISSINRRLILSVAMFVALLTAGCASMSPRKDTLVKDGWSFIRKDVPSAQDPLFDDSHWQTVSLPHTYNALDGQDGGSNYYRGPAWYRTHIKLTSADASQQIFLKFEAASLVADVYINGQHAGQHRGGFGAFCFDITPLIHTGDNTVAVRVENTHFPDIPPLSGDFTVCGGLYRNVHLLILNPISISPLDDASPGVYLTQSHVDQASAQVQVTIKLRNALETNQTIVAACTITDADGKTVAAQNTQQQIPAHSTADASTSITIDHPHLWNGRNNPYLYKATVELSQNGNVLDRVDQPLGLRSYRVDPSTGFILNGHSYPLHGVNIHQDYLNKGWAIDQSDIDTNYRFVNELNCTAVRLAHYQHPDYEYSVCDRSGIVVWAEVPLVERIGDTAAFSDSAKQQLRELIKQNYNHPSICFWSLFNELGPRTRTNWQLVTEMNALAHQLDPTRITVAASHLPTTVPVNWIPDILGFNRYFGWYTGNNSDWPVELDKLHAYDPTRSLGISEYGAGASIHQHENNPTSKPSTKGHWHPEEWQSITHEAAYAAMQNRPWLWGTYVWNLFDFASDGRDEGDTPGRNDKGLVTIDRAVKKDAFYFYKANWNQKDPFVYITSRRFTPHPPGSTQIKIYSNCDTVEILFNHQSLGTQSSNNHIFTWLPFELPPGDCELHAIGKKNGHEFTDTVKWTVNPSP